MKKFYTTVSLSEKPGGYGVILDGKPVQTPQRAPLLAPTKALAEAIMQEWIAQDETIKPETMPLTQILTTQIDRVGLQRHAMTDNLLAYLDTDLLCYRAPEPPELAKRQATRWDPVLAWFADNHGGGEKLATTSGLDALAQPRSAHEGMRAAIEAMDDPVFTVMQLATATTGSVILALAFTQGEITAQQALEASRIEECYQAEIARADLYGLDPVQEKKDLADKRDLEAAAQFLKLI
jgi:chaperone required for assembly of F1-ATPase